jgi:hypothetical protein
MQEQPHASQAIKAVKWLQVAGCQRCSKGINLKRMVQPNKQQGLFVYIILHQFLNAQ